MNLTFYPILACLTVHLLFGPIQWAQAGAGETTDPKSIFEQAARYYEAAHYDQAIEKYTLLLRQGLESGPLYYNLGNCYLKRGKLGKAILNYERAKRIMPTDGDLAFNYSRARSLVFGSSAEGKNSLIKMVDRLSGGLSLNALTLLWSFLYLIILVLLVIKISSKSFRRGWSIVIVIFTSFLLLCFIWGTQQYSAYGQTAVAVTERADVRFQPFDRADVRFSLHEGMKVRILSFKGDWVKIMAFDRQVGWITASAVELI
jgi:tetratricopeptide (TPR) repeat protein